jgi:NADPH2:quinone reductase
MLKDYGSVDNFDISEVPRPVAGPGELLVRVAFAGLRYGDVMARYGIPSRGQAPPFVPGQEVAGVVEEVGEGVSDWSPGDRLAATTLGGGFAEYAAVNATQAQPVPDHVRLDQALVYLVNLPVAYLLVHAWAEIVPGDTVLVHAAAGGVGLLALQVIERRFPDVRVIALTSTSDKAELCRVHGADEVVNYKATSYVPRVRQLTGGLGVDVSLNSVAGPTLATDPQVLRTRGRWVIYGFSAGVAPLDLSTVGYQGLTIRPMSILAFLDQPVMAVAAAFTREWLRSEPLLDPVRYPLERIAEAQLAIEVGRNTGKAVIEL